MEPRKESPHRDAPEAVAEQPKTTFGFIGSDTYEYYEPPTATQEQQRSPVPEYQQHYDQNSTSHRVSTQSPPPPGSDITRSPQLSDGGFTRSRPLSPAAYYSEVHSPDPQMIYNGQEKEAVQTPPIHSKVPSYHAYPTPGLYHQNSGEKPQVWSEPEAPAGEEKKKPFWKKWPFIVIVILLLVLIAVGVALGVVFGTKKSNNHGTSPTNSTGTSTTGPAPSSTANATTPNNPGVNINTAIGGQINNAYYSKSGAWNGSGIAIAAANPAENQAIYAFYQDFEGVIQYTLMNPQREWSIVGPVNAGSYKALNGTPLSTVQHQLGAELVWHLFYIDEDYTIRERIITNTSTNGPSPIWQDGPLNDLNLTAWQSDSIGLQACYWGNYYGQYSYNATQASAGIHLWYASDATVFQQYDWTNGTATWNWAQQWPNLSGNGGVGCQTWDSGMTEYAWFVDTKNDIAMYWKDNNRSETGTANHPVGSWTPINIGVSNVQQDSSLGYTNFMIYQADDTTIRGANVTWGAENTTIAKGNGDNGLDTWTLAHGGQNIHAVRGTHLSITAISNAGSGSTLLTFFQETGDDMQMYTRDGFNSGALWQQAAQDPVTPAST